MKRILITLAVLLTLSANAGAQDFIDTDKVWGVDTTGATQFWQTWADHKTQLGTLYEAADAAITKSDEAETLTANWVNTANPWAVDEGGTGAATLTDGGVLLGSGTGAITPMAVLADSEMIVGDGTTDPVAESGATLRTSIGVAAAASGTHTGTTTIANLVVTTSADLPSTVSLPIPNTIKTAAYTVADNYCYGGVIYVTSAAVITACDALTDGMGFSVITIGAIAVSVDTQSDDKMILDGTTLDDGDKATNTSTTGDMIVCTYYSADGWYCASNSWTDDGA